MEVQLEVCLRWMAFWYGSCSNLACHSDLRDHRDAFHVRQMRGRSCQKRSGEDGKQTEQTSCGWREVGRLVLATVAEAQDGRVVDNTANEEGNAKMEAVS